MKAQTKKVKCPYCGNAMDPIRTNPSDKSMQLIASVYRIKRFICHACLRERKTYDRIRIQLASLAMDEILKN